MKPLHHGLTRHLLRASFTLLVASAAACDTDPDNDDSGSVDLDGGVTPEPDGANNSPDGGDQDGGDQDAGDDPDAPECLLRDCEELAPECLDERTLRTFTGARLDAEACNCSYAEVSATDVPCGDGELCREGACVDRCLGVMCNNDEAPFCGPGERIFAVVDSCNSLTGQCEQTTVRVECAEEGKVCDSGTCVGECVIDANCDLPLNRCDGTTAIRFVGTPRCDVVEARCEGIQTVLEDCAAEGKACVQGSCVAPDSCDEVNCSAVEVCVDGVCVDPCLGQECPAEHCAEDGLSVIEHASEGVCVLSGGEARCDYAGIEVIEEVECDSGRLESCVDNGAGPECNIPGE